ncbi:cysteine proteinases superfamily protein [Striga asiatica]|uniref:Cysteine proteinases superfamily protein n=1 Tax=Striga asiatica TaxID=4170 RepID=A0A5A7PHF6_STRAF|nr:cysteine proteinases superfamily protein [Striga asiatica]
MGNIDRERICHLYRRFLGRFSRRVSGKVQFACRSFIIALLEVIDLKPLEKLLKNICNPLLKSNRIEERDIENKRSEDVSGGDQVKIHQEEIKNRKKKFDYDGGDYVFLEKNKRSEGVSGGDQVYRRLLPERYRPYITKINDVKADGHCGYRVIADYVYNSQDEWSRVRRELLEELKDNPHPYLHECGEAYYLKVIDCINCFETPTIEHHWFDVLDVAILVATRYNVALASLSYSPNGSFETSQTMLPLGRYPDRIICMGLIRSNHFVQS